MSGAGDDVRRAMANPFSMGGFVPSFDRYGVKDVDVQKGTGAVTAKLRREDLDANMARISQDKNLGVWRGPFVYSYFDTRIVRRSNALFADLGNRPYGRNLNFLEYMLIPDDQVSAATSGTQVSVEEEAKQLKEQGKYYSEVGEGPPLEDLDDAFTSMFGWAETDGGHSAKMSFIGRDGYFETARMAIETAMCLHRNRKELEFKGGCLTPTVACSSFLVQRLVDSGLKLSIDDWHEKQEWCPPPFPQAPTANK